MEVMEAIFGRRSCRRFSRRPVERDTVMRLLECASFAPSPANKQPWEFVVAAGAKYGPTLQQAVEEAKGRLAERSGWKWLPGYQVNFLSEAPLLIVVTGNPEQSGAEQFLDEPGRGYEHACCAAIENMLLAAHSLGLATLWLSLFEKRDARRIFGIDEGRDPLAIICLGYAEGQSAAPPRKELAGKVTFLD